MARCVVSPDALSAALLKTGRAPGSVPRVDVDVLDSTPSGRLLPAIKGMLAEAEHALLCVAFVNRKGVALLQPQLKRLGANARLVATSVFGQSTEEAFRALADLGTQVRILNPSKGTYHPKLYLASSAQMSTALVGSANLTSGLLGNVEIATRLRGRAGDPAVAAAWHMGEALWQHPAAVPWTSEVQALLN